MSKSRFRNEVSLYSLTFSDGRPAVPHPAGRPSTALLFPRGTRSENARGETRWPRSRRRVCRRVHLRVRSKRGVGAYDPATAQGHFGPKTASVIARLGQTLMRAIQHAQFEYTESRGPDQGRRAVRFLD
jgi:hypothetical protein